MSFDPFHPFGAVSIHTAVGQFIGVVLGFVGVLALVMFIYAGFIWMTAGGNGDKVKQAKNIFIYSILGLILTFASYSILAFVLDALGNIS